MAAISGSRRRYPLVASAVIIVVAVVTFTAAAASVFISGGSLPCNNNSSLGNTLQSSILSWRRNSNHENSDTIYQNLLRDHADILKQEDERQQQQLKMHIEVSPSSQVDGALYISVFQGKEKSSKRPIFTYSMPRRRFLGGRDEDANSLHDDIDCDDPMYAFEGDELEACKEQQATNAPTQENTSDYYETLFPILGSGGGGAPESGGAASEGTFAGDESTGNPQDLETEYPIDETEYPNNTEYPESAPAPDATPADEIPPPPMDIANGIRLTLSMGIVHLEDLNRDETDMIVSMCLRTTTKILNRYSPFYVKDGMGPLGKKYDDDDDDDDRPEHRRRRHHGSSSSSSSSSEEEEINLRSRQLRQLGGGNHNSGNRPPPLAKLYLSSVHIQESPAMNEWFVIFADYAAYWPSNDRPVLSTKPLYEIDLACHAVLDMSMTRPDFWDTLTSLGYGQHLILHKPTMQDRYEPHEHGLADCLAPGHEYDLSPYLIIDPNAFADQTPPGVEGNASATYPTVIATTASEIVWRTREWVGLTLLVGTTFFVGVLGLIAMRLEDRRMKQQFWGAQLTEQGVNDLLNVGWRYTQGDAALAATAAEATNEPGTARAPTPSTDESGNPQLFLQVFDKTRIGYNDENSLLQGGVERDHPNGGAVVVGGGSGDGDHEQPSSGTPTADLTSGTPS